MRIRVQDAVHSGLSRGLTVYRSRKLHVPFPWCQEEQCPPDQMHPRNAPDDIHRNQERLQDLFVGQSVNWLRYVAKSIPVHAPDVGNDCCTLRNQVTLIEMILAKMCALVVVQSSLT
jgi:hypothetical protein